MVFVDVALCGFGMFDCCLLFCSCAACGCCVYVV